MSGAPTAELHQAASVGLCVCEESGHNGTVYSSIYSTQCLTLPSSASLEAPRPWMASRFRHATQHDCMARLRQKKGTLAFLPKGENNGGFSEGGWASVTAPRTLAGSNVIRHDQQIELPSALCLSTAHCHHSGVKPMSTIESFFFIQ